MGDCRANRQPLVRHEAMQDVDGHAFGIAQMDDGASTRSIRRDNWTTGGLRQLLEVLLRRNRQSKSHESSFRNDRDAIDVGLRPCSSHEQLAFAFRDNGQAKVKQVSLGFADIRTLKMNKQKFVGFDDWFAAARQLDAAGSAVEFCNLRHGWFLNPGLLGRDARWIRSLGK